MLPFALLLRSVPLIALTPLIGMVSGYSLTSVRVVTALVTFFPSLVNISVCLESAPKQSIDLIEAYGGRAGRHCSRCVLPTRCSAVRGDAHRSSGCDGRGSARIIETPILARFNPERLVDN